MLLLRALIRESLSVATPWTDESDPDALELDSWIANRWGGAGVGADAGQDRILEDLVANKFSGLIDYSRQWLRNNPPMFGYLYRGIRVPSKDIPLIEQNGVKGRGQLSSWSDDEGVARGFAAPIGNMVGVLLRVSPLTARRHILYSVKAYAYSKGWDTDSDELDEEEYVLRDFDVGPGNIEIIRR